MRQNYFQWPATAAGKCLTGIHVNMSTSGLSSLSTFIDTKCSFINPLPQYPQSFHVPLRGTSGRQNIQWKGEFGLSFNFCLLRRLLFPHGFSQRDYMRVAGGMGIFHLSIYWLLIICHWIQPPNIFKTGVSSVFLIQLDNPTIAKVDKIHINSLHLNQVQHHILLVFA